MKISNLFELIFESPTEYYELNNKLINKLEHYTNINYNRIYNKEPKFLFKYEEIMIDVLSCFDLFLTADTNSAGKLKQYLNSYYNNLSTEKLKRWPSYPFIITKGDFEFSLSNEKVFSAHLNNATNYLMDFRNISNPSEEEIEFYNVIAIEILDSTLQFFDFDFLSHCSDTSFFNQINDRHDAFFKNKYNNLLSNGIVR